MKNLLRKNRSGFTIIEILIVLAIAGLILTIVFIAVPQLQRAARDNNRQNILSRVKSEMETYAANNQGVYPFKSAGTCAASPSGCWSDFYSRYINNGGVLVNDRDPTTGNSVFGAAPSTYAPVAYSGAVALPTSGTAIVVYGAKCAGEALQASGSAATTTRNYAVMIGLDRTNTYFCLDNG